MICFSHCFAWYLMLINLTWRSLAYNGSVRALCGGHCSGYCGRLQSRSKQLSIVYVMDFGCVNSLVLVVFKKENHHKFCH